MVLVALQRGEWSSTEQVRVSPGQGNGVIATRNVAIKLGSGGRSRVPPGNSGGSATGNHRCPPSSHIFAAAAGRHPNR